MDTYELEGRAMIRSVNAATLKKYALKASMAFTILALLSSPATAGDTTYKYDAQGRVIEVNYPNGSKVTYAYDAAGNRTQVVKTL